MFITYLFCGLYCSFRDEFDLQSHAKPCASRFTIPREGFLVPFSMRLISACVIPVLSDNSFCVNPSLFRASIIAWIISYSGWKAGFDVMNQVTRGRPGNILSAVQGRMSGVKSAFSGTIDHAKSVVSGGPERIDELTVKAIQRTNYRSGDR